MEEDSPRPQEDPVDYSLLHKSEKLKLEFQETVENILFEHVACKPEEATPSQLSDAIAMAAGMMITNLKELQTNWFEASKSVVRPLRDAAQKGYLQFLAEGGEAKKKHWHQCQRRYY